VTGRLFVATRVIALELVNAPSSEFSGGSLGQQRLLQRLQPGKLALKGEYHGFLKFFSAVSMVFKSLSDILGAACFIIWMKCSISSGWAG